MPLALCIERFTHAMRKNSLFQWGLCVPCWKDCLLATFSPVAVWPNAHPNCTDCLLAGLHTEVCMPISAAQQELIVWYKLFEATLAAQLMPWPDAGHCVATGV